MLFVRNIPPVSLLPHTRCFPDPPPCSPRIQVNQNETQLYYSRDVPARAYVPLELLLGRTIDNALLILALKLQCTDEARKLGFTLRDLFEEGCVVEEERDVGLGNGELGRLAVCYLDSSASQGIPVWGIGRVTSTVRRVSLAPLLRVHALTPRAGIF